jgi:outer membrane protein insertion porin family
MLTRTTITALSRPDRGSRFELAIDQTVGDYDFTTVSADYTVYLTMSQDFLERKSTLKLNTRAAYIFGGDAPIYERFYLGGRSFRGFDFRTISPKGIRADTGGPSSEGVGGDWLFFAGTQYEFPLLTEMLSGVVFLDTGTVTEYFGFEDYRVSVGFGARLHVPQLGPVPIAFDFGFPLVKEPTDDEQVFSFTAELPF